MKELRCFESPLVRLLQKLSNWLVTLYGILWHCGHFIVSQPNKNLTTFFVNGFQDSHAISDCNALIISTKIDHMFGVGPIRWFGLLAGKYSTFCLFPTTHVG